MRYRFVLLLYLIASPLRSETSDLSLPVWSQTIRYIRVESAAGSIDQEVYKAINIREGDTLSRPQIRDCLKRINMLKKFNKAGAWVESFEDGCVVIFRIEPDWIIHSIDFAGGRINTLFRYGLISRFSPKSLRKNINLTHGEVFSAQKCAASVQMLKDFYYNNGYAQAIVELVPSFHHENATVDLLFHINQGKPTLVRNITFEGNNEIQSDTLVRHSGVSRNRKFSRKQANEARLKLERYYKRKGFLNVQVNRPAIRYDREKNSISLSFKIVENNPVDITVSTRWHRWNLPWWFYFLENRMDLYLEILGIEESGQIDQARFLEGVRHLEQEFWNHGYLNASVELDEVKDKSGRISYHFQIDEKEPMEVADVKIQGNEFLSIQDIEANRLIATTPGNRFHYDTFLADGDDLANYYKANGFHDVQVTAGYTSGYQKKQVSITFEIKEGLQYRWSAVTVSGNTALSYNEILGILSISPSSPYQADIVGSRIDNLVDHYLELGYADAAIDWHVIGDNTTSPVLDLVIHEGVRSEVETVLINGYTRTLRSVIERNLPSLLGEPFCYKTVLDAERKLIKTNLFRSVQISNPSWEAGSRKRTLVIDVKEQPFVFLEGGPGYNSDRGLNGYLSLYTTNLGGSNRYLGISGSVSEKDSKSNIIFREPEFANLPIQLELRLLTEQTSETDYRLNRRGTRSTWSYRIRDKLRLLLVYRFDNDEPYDIAVDADIPEDYRNSVKIGSLIPGFLFDSRDDPRAPQSGSLLSTKFEFARSMYSSEVPFTKITAEATHFFGFGSRGVLGISLRSGLGYHLPFQEQFRLGGTKSIRGWDFESIRKNQYDEGHTIALQEDTKADLSVLFNIEYRYPLILGLEGVLFFDTGNVYEDYSDAMLSQLKGTTGLGIRFMTPVGPIGVDYGYNVMRDDEDPRERWSFVIGNTF
ncbi:BamA/TamA family outer membrane protein [bacterium]|nr:BamA/TamA family outer membrane protein [candidate division CSSED10-310 bacterium]